MKGNSNQPEIKTALQRNLDGYHSTASFNEIWNSSQLKERRKKYKKPLFSLALISVLTITLFLTPTVKAVFEGLFEFSRVEENEEAGIGWSWSIAGDETAAYQSLADVEKSFQVDVPFPQKLIAAEKNAEINKYSVSTEEGLFLAYEYTLRTKDRMYHVSASESVKEKPQFVADTKEETVTDKELVINGVSARLLGIYDMNGYHMYIEKGNWKMIITGFADASDGKSKITKISEEEMIEIAKTIDW